jgi:hypothetical protein
LQSANPLALATEARTGPAAQVQFGARGEARYGSRTASNSRNACARRIPSKNKVGNKSPRLAISKPNPTRARGQA